jgi:hypothetical protein
LEKRRNIANTLREHIIATTQEEIKEPYDTSTNRNLGKKKKKKKLVQNDSQDLL